MDVLDRLFSIVWLPRGQADLAVGPFRSRTVPTRGRTPKVKDNKNNNNKGKQKQIKFKLQFI
jgi:hypothetical protein